MKRRPRQSYGEVLTFQTGSRDRDHPPERLVAVVAEMIYKLEDSVLHRFIRSRDAIDTIRYLSVRLKTDCKPL